MSYTQLITPNPNIPCAPGWCLQYVRQAYGLPARHPTATAAWEASTSKHYGRDFPDGIWAPVWFALAQEPAGHVVLMAPDGSVYSTSDLGSTPHHHPDLDDLVRYYAYYGMTLTYRGWTEDVAGYPVMAPALASMGTITPVEPEEWDEMASKEEIEKIVREAVKDVVFNGEFDELPGRGRKLTIAGVLGYLGADLSALFTKPFDVQNSKGRTGRTNSLAQLLTWEPSDTAGTHHAIAQLTGLVVAQGEALQRAAAGEPIDYDKIGELIAANMPTFVAVPPERKSE